MAIRRGHKFNGMHVNTPGVYSKVTSDMLNVKTDGAKNIAIIGNAKGGIPGKLMVIDDPEIAKEVVKGGDLLKAMLKAYDPVLRTKIDVELGGADRIFAIRANQATQAKTAVYQENDVEAKIGEVVSTLHASSTGKVSVQGAFSGEENKTFKIVITSEGTKDLADATYRFGTVVEGVGEADNALNETGNATDKELGDGVLVSFAEGKYTKGDTFLIPCTAPVTKTEYAYTIVSKDYGEMNNLISHKLEDGTFPGTKCLVVYDGNKDDYEVFDNIGGTFSIQYTGNQPYADLSVISDGKGNSIKLQTRIGADANTAITDLDVDLDVTKYTSIRQLITYLSSFENYVVEPVVVANGDLTVNDLDIVSRKEIKAVNVPVTAVLRDLQKTTEIQSRLVDIKVINNEVANFENYDFMTLEGATEGASPMSWVKYLDELSTYDIDYIVPLTDDLALIAECREHVIAQSETKGMERRLIWGAYSCASARQAVNNARKTSHSRVQYVGVGGYDFDGKYLPGYLLAAMHAGRAAFLGVESATADIYNFMKPERTFTAIDRRELIDNGVLFFDEVVSDYNHEQFYSKLVWDYTTYTEKNDPLQVERSTGAIADQLSKEVRKDLDQFLTGKLTPTGVLESARNRVLSILKDNIKRGIILAYRNVAIKKVYDATYVDFEVAPTQVNNFTFVNMVFYNRDIDLGTLEEEVSN